MGEQDLRLRQQPETYPHFDIWIGKGPVPLPTQRPREWSPAGDRERRPVMGKENESKKTVEIPVEAHYLEEVVPPKCRKPRHRENVINATIEVPALSGDEAPVALVAKVHTQGEHGWEWIVTPYRLMNGKLFRRFDSLTNAKRFEDGDRLRLKADCFRCSAISIAKRDEEPFVPDEISKELPERPWAFLPENSVDGMMDKVTAIQDELALINGELWIETPEPAYRLIGRYGSRVIQSMQRRTVSFPGGYYLYNAAEWDEQIGRLREIYCKNDEDAQRLEESILRFDRIEVLIPEAVALPSSHEIDTMRGLSSALKRLTDLYEDMDKLYGGEPHPVPLSIYETRYDVICELEDLLDELAVRELRGCGDPESVEKLAEAAISDQGVVQMRLKRYGIE